MFDKKMIEKIVTDAKKEQWDYPKTFNALKGAGVESYCAKISNYEITYYGNGEKWIEQPPKDFIELAIGETFDSNGVGNAVKRHVVRKETNFFQFLEEIASYGVHSYRVDMEARTVTYLGNKGEEYVENIPSF